MDRFNEGGRAGRKIAYATIYGTIQRMLEDNKETSVEQIKDKVLEIYTRQRG